MEEALHRVVKVWAAVPGVEDPDKGGVAKVVNISSKELFCYLIFSAWMLLRNFEICKNISIYSATSTNIKKSLNERQETQEKNPGTFR